MTTARSTTGLPTPLRVLFLEDNDSDVELMLLEFQRSGIEVEWERVETRRDFVARLDAPPDVILADYNLPSFDAVRALEQVTARDLPSVFIVVTGALDDASAADLFAHGAADYLLKDRLARLVPAITQALLQRSLKERQRKAELELSQFFEISHELMAILDFDNRFRRLNSAWHRTLQWQPRALEDRDFFEHVHPADQERGRQWLDGNRRGGEGFHELRFRTRGGDLRRLQLSARPIQELQRIFVVARDVTEDRILEARLERQANLDALTDLPNRRFFEQHLGKTLMGRHGETGRFSLVYLDLDGFKGVNDSFGHQIGDELLVQVAARLKHSLRDGDMVARLGGDEFVMLLTTADQREVEVIMTRVRSALGGEYSLHGHTVKIGASIGIASYPDDGATLDDLLRLADQRMYRAKRGGSVA